MITTSYLLGRVELLIGSFLIMENKIKIAFEQQNTKISLKEIQYKIIN